MCLTVMSPQRLACLPTSSGIGATSASRRWLAARRNRRPSMIDETTQFRAFLHKRGRAQRSTRSVRAPLPQRDGRFHSTSWLATRAYVGDAGIDGPHQYVLQGASQTVALGVTKLAPGHAILADGRAQSPFHGNLGRRTDLRIGGAATRAIGRLGRCSPKSSAFPGASAQRCRRLRFAADHRGAAAWGGTRSSSTGIRPGRRAGGSPWCGRGRPIESSTRSDNTITAGPTSTNSCVVLFFDGLPNTAQIRVPTGARASSRPPTAASLNGGGGEIFLASSTCRISDMNPAMRAFYRGFDAGISRRGEQRLQVGDGVISRGSYRRRRPPAARDR